MFDLERKGAEAVCPFHAGPDVLPSGPYHLVFGLGPRHCIAQDHVVEILTSALAGLLTLERLTVGRRRCGGAMRYDGPIISRMRAQGPLTRATGTAQERSRWSAIKCSASWRRSPPPRPAWWRATWIPRAPRPSATTCKALCEDLGFVHFACLAVLPPADETPSLLLELAIDPGIGADAVVDAPRCERRARARPPVRHPGDTAALRAWLSTHLSRADGGYIGVRDRSVPQIRAEAEAVRRGAHGPAASAREPDGAPAGTAHEQRAGARRPRGRQPTRACLRRASRRRAASGDRLVPVDRGARGAHFHQAGGSGAARAGGPDRRARDDRARGRRGEAACGLGRDTVLGAAAVPSEWTPRCNGRARCVLHRPGVAPAHRGTVRRRDRRSRRASCPFVSCGAVASSMAPLVSPDSGQLISPDLGRFGGAIGILYGWASGCWCPWPWSRRSRWRWSRWR